MKLFDPTMKPFEKNSVLNANQLNAMFYLSTDILKNRRAYFILNDEWYIAELTEVNELRTTKCEEEEKPTVNKTPSSEFFCADTILRIEPGQSKRWQVLREKFVQLRQLERNPATAWLREPFSVLRAWLESPSDTLELAISGRSFASALDLATGWMAQEERRDLQALSVIDMLFELEKRFDNLETVDIPVTEAWYNRHQKITANYTGPAGGHNHGVPLVCRLSPKKLVLP